LLKVKVLLDKLIVLTVSLLTVPRDIEVDRFSEPALPRFIVALLLPVAVPVKFAVAPGPEMYIVAEPVLEVPEKFRLLPSAIAIVEKPAEEESAKLIEPPLGKTVRWPVPADEPLAKFTIDPSLTRIKIVPVDVFAMLEPLIKLT